MTGKLPLLCAIGFHRYREVGAGTSIHRYLECRRCHNRTVRITADGGFQPLRYNWLAGGEWDDKPPTAPFTVQSRSLP